MFALARLSVSLCSHEKAGKSFQARLDTIFSLFHVSTNNTMTAHEDDDPKGVEVDNLFSQFVLATRKITVLKRKVVEKDIKISVQQKAMQNYTDRLSKMKSQICKLRKTSDSLKNDQIKLKKEITELDKTTKVDIKKQNIQNSKIENDYNCENSGD